MPSFSGPDNDFYCIFVLMSIRLSHSEETVSLNKNVFLRQQIGGKNRVTLSLQTVAKIILQHQLS